MKFQYIGDGKESSPFTNVYGYEFKIGAEPVEITDEFVIKKLQGNHTFKAVVEAGEGENSNAKQNYNELKAKAKSLGINPNQKADVLAQLIAEVEAGEGE